MADVNEDEPHLTPGGVHRLHRVVLLAMVGGAVLVLVAVAGLTATGGRGKDPNPGTRDPKATALRAGCWPDRQPAPETRRQISTTLCRS